MDITRLLTSATTESRAPASLYDSTRGLILTSQFATYGATQGVNLSSHFLGSSSGITERRSSGRFKTQRKKSSLREHAAALMQPPKKVGPPPTVWRSIRAILMVSYLNVLLICIPISCVLNFVVPDRYTLIFSFSFLAILPLANLLAFATDELSMRVGQTLAGLMNATLGNAVELIVSIIALTKCEIDIVQSSLVGSVLSNLLLVLGMCFFAGGLNFSEQGFGLVAAQLNSSLLTISVIAVLLPGAFVMALSKSTAYDSTSVNKHILEMSHGVAIILLFIYASYLFFQLFSHKSIYEDDNEEIMESKKYRENPFKFKSFRNDGTKRPAQSQYTEGGLVDSPTSIHANLPAVENGAFPPGRSASNPDSGDAQVEDETEEPQMSVSVSLALLVIITVLVSVESEFLVDSINGLASTGTISKEFIGVILLPIVGNAAEHATAVMVSVKDKLTLSVSVAVGSSIQIALFVIPFMVTLGWMLDKPLTLLFDPLQSTVLFLSVLTVNYVVQDGRSNWLEGMILMCLYLILCVTFWYYPGTEPVLSC